MLLEESGEDSEALKLLGAVKYAELSEKYDGQRIAIQTIEYSKLTDIYLAAFCWYYRNVKRYDFNTCKKMLGRDISSKKIGMLAKSVQELITRKTN